jgi:hypothetical protein
MDFILSVDPDTGRRKLWPNKTNTPKEVLDQGIEHIEVDTAKDKLMEFIQDLLDRIPGDEQPTPVPAEIKIETEAKPKSIDFDEAWDTFPLARKLHFAASAMEEARDIINPAKYQRII